MSTFPTPPSDAPDQPPRLTPRFGLAAFRHRWRDQLVAVVWLVLVWNMLWGDFSWGNLVGGTLVALFVLLFFPLPSVTFGGRIRPVALLTLILRFLADLVVASFQIAATALRIGYQPHSAIIAVQLRIRSDLNLTLTAEALSLVPGSLIVEADRENGVLYIHVLDVKGPQDVAAAHRRAHEMEARIVRAIGSATELRALEIDIPDPRPGSNDREATA